MLKFFNKLFKIKKMLKLKFLKSFAKVSKNSADRKANNIGIRFSIFVIQNFSKKKSRQQKSTAQLRIIHY